MHSIHEQCDVRKVESFTPSPIVAIRFVVRLRLDSNVDVVVVCTMFVNTTIIDRKGIQ